MTLEVIQVSSRRERKQFLELPWEMNAKDPCWVPPLRMNQKEMVGYSKNPFYDTAEIQTFLALKNGKPVGRIGAILNHAHIKYSKEEIGFFGFFESIHDEEVSGRMFDAASKWMTERGIKKMRGPTNPSLNHECGLLIKGFETDPFFMMTHNPAYYAELIEGYGFKKAMDMYAFWGHVDMLKTMSKKMEFMSEAVQERFNVTIRPLNKKHFQKELEMFLKIYNLSLVDTWGFVPLSDAEVRHIGAGMKHLIIPELARIAEIDGKPVGSVFALLDYNKIIRKIDGKLFPTGFIKLLTQRRKLTGTRLISTNVLPEYQSWGIGVALAYSLLVPALEWGIQEAEFSWVLETNDLSRKTLEKAGAKRTKTYRLYDYQIEE